jgi:phosphatidylserine/phosphatidylglycerophosphate/cardiolipin synthase-like enzyme
MFFNKNGIDNAAVSELFTNDNFYQTFCKDLSRANSEVIIESPFITIGRFNEFVPHIKRIRRRGVTVTVNTRYPEEHEGKYIQQAYDAVCELQGLGVKVLYTTKLHRKIAIIDRKISWEGSLNILSYSNSCEVMRRTKGSDYAKSILEFLKIY